MKNEEHEEGQGSRLHGLGTLLLGLGQKKQDSWWRRNKQGSGKSRLHGGLRLEGVRGCCAPSELKHQQVDASGRQLIGRNRKHAQ